MWSKFCGRRVGIGVKVVVYLNDDVSNLVVAVALDRQELIGINIVEWTARNADSDVLTFRKKNTAIPMRRVGTFCAPWWGSESRRAVFMVRRRVEEEGTTHAGTQQSSFQPLKKIKIQLQRELCFLSNSIDFSRRSSNAKPTHQYFHYLHLTTN